MGKVKKAIIIAGIPSLVFLGMDAGKSHAKYQAGQRAIIEEPFKFGGYPQEESFVEWYFGEWTSGLTGRNMYQRLSDELVGRIESVNGPESVRELEGAILNEYPRYRDPKPFMEAGIRTLARNQAKDSLYRIAVKDGFDMQNLIIPALRELDKIDRSAAFRAAMEIVSRQNKPREWQAYIRNYTNGDSVNNVLIDMGTPEAFNYFMRLGDPNTLALFVLKNKDKRFVYARKEKIIDAMVNALSDSNGINCSSSSDTLTVYGRAIYQLSPSYARIISSAAERDCHQTWVEEHLDGKNGLLPFLHALEGR